MVLIWGGEDEGEKVGGREQVNKKKMRKRNYEYEDKEEEQKNKEEEVENEEDGGKRWMKRRRMTMKNSPRWPSASARRRCLWSLARSGRWGGRRSLPPLRKTTNTHQSGGIKE